MVTEHAKKSKAIVVWGSEGPKNNHIPGKSQSSLAVGQAKLYHKILSSVNLYLQYMPISFQLTKTTCTYLEVGRTTVRIPEKGVLLNQTTRF